MMHKSMRFCRLVSFLFLLFTSHLATLTVIAFTGTYGINYGRIADNIPSPEKVVQLLRAAKIRNVRIFDFNHSVLQAFSGTGLELVVGLPNGYLQDMSANADHALNWVKDNIQQFYPQTRIVGIAIGNEVFENDQQLWGVLLGAVKNIYNATKSLGLDHKIQITTSHSFGVFDNSYPPSNCTFRDNVKEYMVPLMNFFSQIKSPFCLNAYPFLTYMSDPKHIDLNYALFQKNAGIIDSQTKLHYDNLLDAQIDAAYAALEDAGFKKMEIIVTETGWASRGDPSEEVATVENARTYHYNLRKRLALRKGTPMRPKIMLRAYVFAIFNEDDKPGPTHERNFGLWKPDGSISYDVGFPALKSSAVASSFLSLKDMRAQGWLTPYSTIFTTCMITLFLLLRF
ncbi:glucan endo-1,3-beta-glucosidase 14-like isoform X1 [Amaranthus tricolor]|uniref:glucan endo-1,3-beta-glucosidase 14-like isoform X1 n=1 Tax=Amaranthus tricolor TaxID=29722 RepID=UPI00258EA6EE|nr:glucan endo-1,3-beta-glucosidase 14-like isoform X1 [Amaranthus tricolor]